MNAVPESLDALPPGAEVKKTTCYMCACRCGIRVHLQDGVARYIDGNPDHPINQGVICAKGGAGIMKQYSPARLTRPLRRKAGAERGAGEFEPISWEEALGTLGDRLAHLRATAPEKFALFTGRDQMQALTALFARQFGTPNYAAHGGFCSVNMAAGMMYTMGGSFWEFGGPDLDRAKVFLMLGTAEDHHSNPLKIALSKFKRAGGRFITVNPVRTGYSAIADDWIPIRPGTDGALLMALCHVLVRDDQVDHDFLRRYTNAPQLVRVDEDDPDRGFFALRRPANDEPTYDQRHQWIWDEAAGALAGVDARPEEGARPALEGEYVLPDGHRAVPSYVLLKRRVAEYTPERAEEITGIPAARIEALARELAHAAFEQSISLPIAWTDSWGHRHEEVIGRPVAFHAMRGLAAHSNGFHTVRAMAVLMSLLGTVDRPGGFRHKAPYPRAIPPNYKNPRGWQDVKPGQPLAAMPLGFPGVPEDLAVDEHGAPIRIDKAFSWEFPLSAHGLMHSVITNAWRGDPYRIDTLLIFMANMAWNSSMNTTEVRRMLNERDPATGEHRIPFVVVADAFQSEMTAFADLILPDTTYLERHDAMSLLDRPISEFDGPCDSVRVPVLPPTGECRPFQDVLVELASRLKLPAFTTAEGGRKFADYKDFVIRFEPHPGLGFLSGWRGTDGSKSMRGEPNPDQWERYAENDCVHHFVMPESQQWMRNWNREYMEFCVYAGFRKLTHPIMLHLYSEVLHGFRAAATGQRAGRQPPDHLRERVAAHFDPLPFWSPPLEAQATDLDAYPLHAITQRPMAMYHSWDSQNAWLRQIHSRNVLFVHSGTLAAAGIEDGGWAWVESPWGRVRCIARASESVEPGTVWTWNAIGKARGAWNLAQDADESREGFLLNHLISDELPGMPSADGSNAARLANADPVTGQAAWYDVRVRLRPAPPGELADVGDATTPPHLIDADATWPRPEGVPPLPGTAPQRAAQAVLRWFVRRPGANP
jgi:anaerobic selenocysteine-containing dehydrogenase